MSCSEKHGGSRSALSVSDSDSSQVQVTRYAPHKGLWQLAIFTAKQQYGFYDSVYVEVALVVYFLLFQNLEDRVKMFTRFTFISEGTLVFTSDVLSIRPQLFSNEFYQDFV